jgi:hypothetical protein
MAPRYVLRWHNPDDVSQTWHRARRQDLSRRARTCNHKACLTQLVEYKAFNLEVVGSSLTAGVQYFLSLSLIYFFCRDFFVYAAPYICSFDYINFFLVKSAEHNMDHR